MKLGTALAFLAGLALLGVVLAESDLGATWHILQRFDWHGVALVTVAFVLAWGAEIVAWALTFGDRPLRPAWLSALWLTNMVGEALNVVMPFGSLGGEPVKGWLLKQHHDVGWRESAATLFLMQTLLALAEAVFAAIGAFCAWRLGILPPALEQPLLAAAIVLVVAMGVVMFGLQQRWLRGLLERIGRRLRSERWARAHAAVLEVEHAVVDFARARPRRFVASTSLFLLNWIGGAVEVWLVMRALGAPIGFGAAWVAEAAIVMIRSLTFFLPAQLGSVEAVTVLVIDTIAGGHELGLALAVVRRVRELAWSALGLLVGLGYNLRGAPVQPR